MLVLSAKCLKNKGICIDVLRKVRKISGSEQRSLPVDGPYTRTLARGNRMSTQITRTPVDYKNLAGRRYNLLTIVRAADDTQTMPSQRKWECLCDCGRTAFITAASVVNGLTKSCGCLKHVSRPKGARVECTCKTCGKTFSDYRSNRRQACSVECGNRLKRGNKTHGQSRSRLYNIWSHMKSRCNLPTGTAWAYYGGRGIKVCPEWDLSFINFQAWAFQNGYAPGLELDRINTDGDYSPENCRWATRSEQMRNTRKRRDAQTSRFKGVSLHSQNKRWVAQIHFGGKTYHIGLFDSEIEAARAYDAEALKRFGLFARTNFSQGGVPR